jgi:flagellar biosynthetic protein FliO
MNATPELLPSALRMIAALAAVLGGLWVAMHFVRRYLQRRRPAQRRLVRVVASQPIGVKKAVTLVEVPGCVLVLGVSGDRIQLLTRLKDPQVLERIGSDAGAETDSFVEHLSRLASGMTAGDHDR